MDGEKNEKNDVNVFESFLNVVPYEYSITSQIEVPLQM